MSKMQWITVIVLNVIYFIRDIKDAITDIVFGLIYKEPRQRLPPIKDPIILENARSLAIKIRKREVKSEDVVRAYISRIKEVNPMLNAVVDQRFEDALQDARDVDKNLASSKATEEELAKKYPLLGVPFTVKENFEVEGLHQTVGLVARRNYIGKTDASAVKLMRRAGAILLGVTNLSEMCSWWESGNSVYGRSNNPYDVTRIVGGSSGGEGCILGGAGSVIGVGSDIGGSIRMPAFFNGVFGHKPTFGLICNDGQLPHAYDELNKYLVSGPMCRYAGDLKILMKVLLEDTEVMRKMDMDVDLKKIRIFYMENDGGFPFVSRVSPELCYAQRKVINHFEKAHGVKSHKVLLPKLTQSLEMWSNIMTGTNAPSTSELLSDNQKPINMPWELCKWCIGQSDHTLTNICLCLGESLGLSRNREAYEAAISLCETLREELEELLGDDGILIYPSHPRPAPFHHQPVFMSLNFAYATAFSVTGHPVTQCPLGLGKQGLPLGVQVVSGLKNDHLTLAVACEIENAFGGWVCPSQILAH